VRIGAGVFVATIVCGGGPLSAQAAREATSLSFDVASVKPNTSVEGERGFGFQPGGRFTARNVRLRELIAAAYGTPQPLPSFRIVGGPGWVGSEPYDVVAKAAADFPETAAQPGWSISGELMLRTLLTDRFNLAVHRETRDLPSYELVVARPDRRLGQRLRPSSGDDCTPRGSTGADIPCGGFRGSPIHMSARAVTMDLVARFLENMLGRVVLDRTALNGTWSLDLDYAPETASGGPPLVNGQVVDVPSIFAALQEQLGLKLAPITAPVDVIVIDHVERPTPD
jgi:uncharacterized protein (TIGR03435 family)